MRERIRYAGSSGTDGPSAPVLQPSGQSSWSWARACRNAAFSGTPWTGAGASSGWQKNAESAAVRNLAVM